MFNKLKEMLGQIVKEKIREALTVKVRFERRRDVSGQPLAVPEIEVRDVYLPNHWIEFLPYYEAAIRGNQETVDHVKNAVIGQKEAVEAVARLLLQSESALKAIASIAAQYTVDGRYTQSAPSEPLSDSHIHYIGDALTKEQSPITNTGKQ